MSLSETDSCPLCLSPEARTYAESLGRSFLQCEQCKLVFCDPQYRLSNTEEIERYKLHENHDSPGYRKFLSRLAEVVQQKLPPGSRGLDYGCGPNPLLAKMLSELGYDCCYFDPIYFADRPLKGSHQFVLLSEVVEHFHDVRAEFKKLKRLVSDDGFIVISTSFLPADFSNWHYQRDPTHVSFYNAESLEFVAKILGKKSKILSKNLAVLEPSP